MSWDDPRTEDSEARGSGTHHEADSGLYVIWLALDRPARVSVGALGAIDFPPGVYAYVGSAQRHRAARVQRHLRREKVKRWHIDYFRPYTRAVAVSYLTSEKAGECRLADRLALELSAKRAYPRFGASDCACEGHLLYLRGELPVLSSLEGVLPGLVTESVGDSNIR